MSSLKVTLLWDREDCKTGAANRRAAYWFTWQLTLAYIICSIRLVLESLLKYIVAFCLWARTDIWGAWTPQVKLDIINLTLSEGYPAWGSDANGLLKYPCVKVPPTQKWYGVHADKTEFSRPRVSYWSKDLAKINSAFTRLVKPRPGFQSYCTRGF